MWDFLHYFIFYTFDSAQIHMNKCNALVQGIHFHLQASRFGFSPYG